MRVLEHPPLDEIVRVPVLDELPEVVLRLDIGAPFEIAPAERLHCLIVGGATEQGGDHVAGRRAIEEDARVAPIKPPSKLIVEMRRTFQEVSDDERGRCSAAPCVLATAR